jgi:hypothetical protein
MSLRLPIAGDIFGQDGILLLELRGVSLLEVPLSDRIQVEMRGKRASSLKIRGKDGTPTIMNAAVTSPTLQSPTGENV